MTFTYTPTGLVAPVPDYVLPQDVLDMVVVETVNNPLISGADNVAWLLLLLNSTRSIANYGAVAGGVVDNTAIIQQAIDDQHTAGGGIVYVPKGRYRCNGTLSIPNDVSLRGAPRGSILALNHATANMFTIAESFRGSFVDLSLEGDQANTGNVFDCQTAAELLAVRVRVNFAASNLQGKLINTTSSSGQVNPIFEDCTVATFLIGSSPIRAALTTINRGRWTLPPGADRPFVEDTIGSVVASGATFAQIPTTGSVAFFSANSGSGGFVSLTGCRFDVAAGGGSPTYAVDILGGKLITADNDFDSVVPYRLGGVAVAGSVLQLLPLEDLGSTAATTIDAADGYASSWTRITATFSVITFNLPNILFIGQQYVAINQNGSGSNQTTTYVPQGSDTAICDDVGPDGGGRTMRSTFLAIDRGGNPTWVQIATVE